MIKLPELLAPAGDWEKMETAFRFGADAVFLGGKEFGLRAGSGNFTLEEIKNAVNFAHSQNKKIYVTVNAYPTEEEFGELVSYLKSLETIGVDAAIVADPGVFRLARREAPGLPIHVSTQANVINSEGVSLWSDLGAERVILARETTLREIGEITQKCDIEIEAFVHGAMCWAYSGRCLLSAGITGKSANQGACTQVCRWKFSLLDESRPNAPIRIEEDERGTYLMNSKDMSMIEHIPELVDSGLSSLKIEGRMKTIHYLATVVKVYREALDAYQKDGEHYAVDPKWIEELDKFSHRPYDTGFYFDNPQSGNANIDFQAQYIQTRDFVGVVLDWDEDKKLALIEQRNVIVAGDTLEILQPTHSLCTFTVKMWDEEGNEVARAPHPKQKLWIYSENRLEKGSIVRKVV